MKSKSFIFWIVVAGLFGIFAASAEAGGKKENGVYDTDGLNLIHSASRIVVLPTQVRIETPIDKKTFRDVSDSWPYVKRRLEKETLYQLTERGHTAILAGSSETAPLPVEPAVLDELKIISEDIQAKYYSKVGIRNAKWQKMPFAYEISSVKQKGLSEDGSVYLWSSFFRTTGKKNPTRLSIVLFNPSGGKVVFYSVIGGGSMSPLDVTAVPARSTLLSAVESIFSDFPRK